MDVMKSGSTIAYKLPHCQKAYPPIAVHELGNTTSTKLVQFENACSGRVRGRVGG
jgi:hypothetical protein